MTTVLVTGSTDGVGRATADALLDEGHDVIVHARTPQRLDAVRDLLDRGARSVVGDLADLDQVRSLVDQVGEAGGCDVVIHNAGVIDGPSVLPVNVVAPYVLTELLPGVARVVYVSSSMHRGGRADLTGIDWSGDASRTYSDSKLFVTTLMAATARRRPDMIAHAVDPGWVPTKMGGPGATDDLALAHVTQVWLATSDDPEALASGRYWFHGQVEDTAAAVTDEAFQDAVCASLADHAASSEG